MTRVLAHRQFGRVAVALELKIEDAWIGAFWRRDLVSTQVWVCLLPCLPVHVTVYR